MVPSNPLAAVDRELLRWLRLSRAAPPRGQEVEVGRPVDDRAIDAVRRELAAFGIRDRFRFVWSGDGSGVEEDAPDVIHIHRGLPRAARAPGAVLDAADRVLALDLASVARHELGHAILFRRPRDARAAGFRRLFGDVRVAYRVGAPIDEVERRMRRHGGLGNPRYRRVISLYAATHPHERFAEAVRLALRARGDERALARWAQERGMANVVTEQLLYAARWLRSVGSG
jgi:hypothetical protein